MDMDMPNTDPRYNTQIREDGEEWIVVDMLVEMFHVGAVDVIEADDFGDTWHVMI